jgi:hypothetical protein
MGKHHCDSGWFCMLERIPTMEARQAVLNAMLKIS